MVFSKHLFALVPLAMIASSASAEFVINEIDPDTPGTDAAEFIELKGDPNQSLVGLTLVVYNGTGTAGAAPRAKAAYDLAGTANAQGYYVIGDPGVPGVSLEILPGTIENGEDAVAIYRNTSAAAFTATNAAGATSPATAPGTLIDHVIWESDADNTPNWTPFTLTAVDEAAGGDPANHSIARDPDGTGNFVLAYPTPNAPNNAIQQKEVNAPAAVNFGRSNKATITSRTVTIRNTGLGTMTVSAFALDAGSDPEFSVVAGPNPALPASLAQNQATTVVVQFSNSDVAASQAFTGSLNYVTDDPTSGSGSIALSAEFVKVLQTGSVGDVVINEYSYNPNAGAANGGIQDYNGDGIITNANDDEFIEIYNTTASPINIQRWEVNAQNGPTGNNTIFPFVFPVGTTLPAGGVAVVFNAGTPTGFPAGVAFGDGPGLANAGATIEVTDGTTRLDGVAYGEQLGVAGFTSVSITAVGGSVGRRPDGSATFVEFPHNSATLQLRPTPGLNNGSLTSAQDWQLFE